jgi:signal transduction histidine kinase
MTAPVTFVRSEDMLDESVPKRLARSFRLSRRRQISGLVLAVFLLPLLTLLLSALEDELALDGQVLVYLLAVVVIAMVGGVLVAIASAIAAATLINYYFVEPVHTFSVGDPDQVVTLVVFVVVAALVSGAVELATRRAHVAERALAEAETMSALAGPDLDAQESLRDVLRRARDEFKMESVTLAARQRGSGTWIDVEHAGWAPEGQEAPLRFDIPIGPHLRLLGRGPALFAEDERVLEAFAAAAATAYEGRVLSGEAEEARALATVDKQRTSLLAAVGHDLRTPLAGIKAAVTTLRQSDVEWSDEERRELLGTIEAGHRRSRGHRGTARLDTGSNHRSVRPNRRAGQGGCAGRRGGRLRHQAIRDGRAARSPTSGASPDGHRRRSAADRDGGLHGRSRGKGGAGPRRRAGATHTDRMARPRGPRPQRRQVGPPASATTGGLGTELRDRDKLPARLLGSASAEA